MPAPATDERAARTELKRVVQRWQQLPLDHALSRMPVVRSVVQRLADAVADAEGRAHVQVPDLGTAVVMDQLTVMVHDALTAGRASRTHQLPPGSVVAADPAQGAQPLTSLSIVAVVDELVGLRRALS